MQTAVRVELEEQVVYSYHLPQHAVHVGDGLLHDLRDVGEVHHLSEETKTGDFVH